MAVVGHLSRTDVLYLVELRSRMKRALRMSRCVGAGVLDPDREDLIRHALFAHYRSFAALGLESEARWLIGTERVVRALEDGE